MGDALGDVLCFGDHNSTMKWTIWTAKRLIKHLKVMTFGEGENTLGLLSLQKKKI